MIQGELGSTDWRGVTVVIEVDGFEGQLGGRKDRTQ